MRIIDIIISKGASLSEGCHPDRFLKVSHCHPKFHPKLYTRGPRLNLELSRLTLRGATESMLLFLLILLFAYLSYLTGPA